MANIYLFRYTGDIIDAKFNVEGKVYHKTFRQNDLIELTGNEVAYMVNSPDLKKVLDKCKKKGEILEKMAPVKAPKEVDKIAEPEKPQPTRTKTFKKEEK
jgi:hypothetical protein